jgi:hypothetical protein
MSSLTKRSPTAVDVVVIIVMLPAAWFCLLFGVANLIHPEVPAEYLTQNTLMCLLRGPTLSSGTART